MLYSQLEFEQSAYGILSSPFGKKGTKCPRTALLLQGKVVYSESVCHYEYRPMAGPGNTTVRATHRQGMPLVGIWRDRRARRTSQ